MSLLHFCCELGIIIQACQQVSQGLYDCVWAGHVCGLVGSGRGWEWAGGVVLTHLSI